MCRPSGDHAGCCASSEFVRRRTLLLFSRETATLPELSTNATVRSLARSSGATGSSVRTPQTVPRGQLSA